MSSFLEQTDLRFPRTGLALLPASLRPLFKESIRHRPLSDGTRFSLTEELGGQIWERRTPADIELIARSLCTGLHQGVQKVRSRKEMLAKIRVPRAHGVTSIDELSLSRRVLAQLKRHHLLNPATLAECSLKDLMVLPAFGVRRLFELLAVLESCGAAPARVNDPLTLEETRRTSGTSEDLKCLEDLEQLLGACDIQTSDVRFGPLIKQLRTQAPSLKKALQALKVGAPSFSHETQDPWGALRARIGAIRELLKKVQSGTLEEDLCGLLRIIARPERKSRALGLRLGWADGQERTLQVVGDIEGLTRERIRQFEAKAQNALHQRSVFAPKLTEALALARAQVPCAGEELAQALIDRGLTTHAWQPSVLISAASFLGIAHGLTLTDVGGGEYLASDPANVSLAELLLSKARNIACTEGAVCLKDLSFALSEELQRFVSEREVRAITTALPQVCWLDRAKGWLWFGSDQPRNRVLNAIRKMLSVSPRLMIDELYEGVIRSYRMDAEPVCPKPIVLALCGQTSWIRVRQSSHVTPRSPIPYQEVLVGVERTMVEVLLEAGGALDHHSWRRICRERGVPPSSFGVNEGNSPVFRRIRPHIWGLRGVHVAPTLLLELTERVGLRQRELARSQSERSLSAYPEGSLLGSNAYRKLFGITASTFRHHVLNAPQGANIAPGTQFDVSLEGETIGQVLMRERGRLKGMMALLKTVGVERGEAFIASFDLDKLTISLTRTKPVLPASALGIASVSA